MATYTEALEEGAREAFCELAPPAMAGALIFAGIGTAGVADAVAIAAGAGVAYHAYSQYCNKPIPDESLPAPPFPGGQCNVDYNVTYAFEYSINADSSSPTYTPGSSTINFVPGPISGIRTVTSGGGSGIQIVIDRNGGTTGGFGVSGSPGSIAVRNARITSLVPSAGGDPNACGSLAPVPPEIQPGDNVVTNPVTYTTNNDVTVNITPTFTFGNINFNIAGNTIVPVTINFSADPRFDISGEINLNSGNITINPTPGGNRDGCNPPPDDLVPADEPPPPPTGTPIEPPNPPEPPDRPTVRALLRGVGVTVTTLPAGISRIDQSQNPNVYYPNLGQVQFQVQTGTSVWWTKNVPVNNRREIIECTWPSGAIAVRGTPREGVEWTLTPIYAKQTLVETYPPE